MNRDERLHKYSWALAYSSAWASGNHRRAKAGQNCSWERIETLGVAAGGVRSRTPAVMFLFLLMLDRLWPGHTVPPGPCPAGQGAAAEQPGDNRQEDEQMPNPHPRGA